MHTLGVRTIATGLHPSDLLTVGGLYVAESDNDSVGIYCLPDLTRAADVFVGDFAGNARLAGVSPNASPGPMERSTSVWVRRTRLP